MTFGCLVLYTPRQKQAIAALGTSLRSARHTHKKKGTVWRRHGNFTPHRDKINCGKAPRQHSGRDTTVATFPRKSLISPPKGPGGQSNGTGQRLNN
jgi:hypothetical protein